MELSSETQANYARIIDGILAASDINTISASRIRKGLQATVNEDLEPQKAAIKLLIVERFDKYNAAQEAITNPPEEPNPKPLTNGHAVFPKLEETETSSKPVTSSKRTHSEEEAEVSSDITENPAPRKKKRKRASPDEDAIYAAKLQAEENSRARPTRGLGVKKRAVIKKKSGPRKKSAKAVKAEDDSEIGSDSQAEPAKEVKRTGGFHKAMNLSTPLSELLDGETTLSRPQTVKRIWAYIKEQDLQDPNDKREIRCDDRMKAVFKSDRVHMFTMNKLLNQHLYPVEE